MGTNLRLLQCLLQIPYFHALTASAPVIPSGVRPLVLCSDCNVQVVRIVLTGETYGAVHHISTLADTMRGSLHYIPVDLGIPHPR